MAPLPVRQSRLWPPTLLLLLLSLALQGARPEPAGRAVPAQSRPCVDCHAFEFMQRALQDLRKTAYSLDARISQVQGCSRGSIPYRKEFLDIRGRENGTVLQLETPRPSCCRPNEGPSVLAGQLDAEDP